MNLYFNLYTMRFDRLDSFGIRFDTKIFVSLLCVVHTTDLGLL